MQLNGDNIDTVVGSIEDLLEQCAIRRQGVAVAINGEIVPRSLWQSTFLQVNDEIEIVTAAAGG